MIKTAVFVTLIAIAVAGCNKKTELTQHEGFVEVNGGKIWYRVKGQRAATPLLLVHGGPGYPSYYLNPLQALCNERPVIMFDQLGCGRSGEITDTALMTTEAHVQQIEKLVEHLGLNEFYLLGHSWGSMLGTEYYLKHKDRVKGVILASPCLSAKRWMADADTLISMLPDPISTILRNDVNGIQQESGVLSAAMYAYYDNYYLRKLPSSAYVDSSNTYTGFNIYKHMWGTSEFFASGSLKEYDRTDELRKFQSPTLYITGEFDEARPNTVKYYQSLTPDSKFVLVPDAGHIIMHDNPSVTITAISDFLNELDQQ